MTRRRRPDHFADNLAGVLASFDGRCPRCDGPIISRQSQVVRRHGEWIHVSCAPGWDDER